MSGRKPFRPMSYWTATSEFEEQHGGPPVCHCGETMFAEDDHGRYRCTCGRSYDVVTGSSVPETIRIPQVTDILSKKDAENLTDEKKAEIPPLYHLFLKPTEEEAEALRLLMSGEGYYTEPDGTIRPLTPEEKERDRKEREKYEK